MLPERESSAVALDLAASAADAQPVQEQTARVIPLDDLPETPDAHRFEGANQGDVPVSFILVHSPPGSKPVALHRHPYAEVFIVQAGEATFTVGRETVVVGAGHVVVSAANQPHGFANSGRAELRMVNIHASERFVTEWLSRADADR